MLLSIQHRFQTLIFSFLNVHPLYLCPRALWRRRSTHSARPHFFLAAMNALTSIEQDTRKDGHTESTEAPDKPSLEFQQMSRGDVTPTC